MLLCYIFPSVSLFLSLPPKCISHFHFFYAYLIMTQGWGPAAGGIRQSYKSKWVNRLAYHFCRHLSVQWSHYSICLCVTVVFAHTCSIFFFFVSLFVKTKTSKKYHNIFLLNFLWTHLWRNKLGVTVQSTIRFQEINPRWLVWLHTKSVDEHGSGDSPAFRFGRCGLFFLETAVWFFVCSIKLSTPGIILHMKIGSHSELFAQVWSPCLNHKWGFASLVLDFQGENVAWTMCWALEPFYSTPHTDEYS